MGKRTVCYISRSEGTSRFIANQLMKFLGEYVNVYVWYLAHEDILPYATCDIYILGSNTVYEIVKDQLPPQSHVILASRSIGTQNLDKLFEIPPDTPVAVVGYWEEVALSVIKLLKDYGFNYLKMIPYFKKCRYEIPEDVEIAISPGVNYVVPTNIKRIIDIGVRGLDISTFAEIIDYLELPKGLFNTISNSYVEAMFNLSYRFYKMASKNEELKKNTEIILDSVDEAIVSVNKKNIVVVFNPAAEKLLEVNKIQVINKDAREVIPQVDFLSCIETGVCIHNEIKRINHNYFILSTNPIYDEKGETTGVVSIFRPVGQVKELEGKVRRELKDKGNMAKYTFSHIIGQSKEVIEGIAMAKKFAKTDLTILIQGDSGTGKEIFAQAIHNYSDRNDNPFVAINFAALPENLVESELFGYEGGAFTGAKKGGKAGLFEEAHMGTILLDEIGDASSEVQKRLLRVLEERKVRRVGGNTLTPVDIRVIAATNQNLEALMKKGLFREDLFYRLCTLPINIPSLKYRGEDIFILIDYFSNKLYNRTLKLEPPLKDFLLSYGWPGNIRELQNVVKYLCSMVKLDEAVTFRHLPTYMVRNEEKVLDSEIEAQKSFDKKTFQEVLLNIKKQNLLEPIIMILREIHSVSIFNQGIGRQALHKNLEALDSDFPDHKIRKWIKMLEELGFIEVGRTRQGSKISREGEAFLAYIEEKRL